MSFLLFAGLQWVLEIREMLPIWVEKCQEIIWKWTNVSLKVLEDILFTYFSISLCSVIAPNFSVSVLGPYIFCGIGPQKSLKGP